MMEDVMIIFFLILFSLNYANAQEVVSIADVVNTLNNASRSFDLQNQSKACYVDKMQRVTKSCNLDSQKFKFPQSNNDLIFEKSVNSGCQFASVEVSDIPFAARVAVTVTSGEVSGGISGSRLGTKNFVIPEDGSYLVMFNSGDGKANMPSQSSVIRNLISSSIKGQFKSDEFIKSCTESVYKKYFSDKVLKTDSFTGGEGTLPENLAQVPEVIKQQLKLVDMCYLESLYSIAQMSSQFEGVVTQTLANDSVSLDTTFGNIMDNMYAGGSDGVLDRAFKNVYGPDKSFTFTNKSFNKIFRLSNFDDHVGREKYLKITIIPADSSQKQNTNIRNVGEVMFFGEEKTGQKVQNVCENVVDDSRGSEKDIINEGSSRSSSSGASKAVEY